MHSAPGVDGKRMSLADILSKTAGAAFILEFPYLSQVFGSMRHGVTGELGTVHSKSAYMRAQFDYLAIRHLAS